MVLDGLTNQDVDLTVCITDQSGMPAVRRVALERDYGFAVRYRATPGTTGLSRGRNEWMQELDSDIVAFPDDDCRYTPGLLAGIRDRFAASADVGLISVRQVTPSGEQSMLRWKASPVRIRPHNVPRTVNSSTLFFRRSVVESVGRFDEHLGVGSGTGCGAGEENDYVLRSLRTGIVGSYDPTLLVIQPDWRVTADPEEVLAKAYRYNQGFGCTLRKNRRPGDMTYWAARSALGVLAGFLKSDSDAVALQRAQLAGRLTGWFHG
jgi:glycosyltransferase involved in cell wall biosynthesis